MKTEHPKLGRTEGGWNFWQDSENISTIFSNLYNTYKVWFADGDGNGYY